MEVRFLQLGLALLLLLAAQHAPAIAVPGPQCQMHRGGVEIPYPFDISLDCSLAVDYNISCKVLDGVSKPILFTDTELLDISMFHGTIRVLNPISTYRYNTSSRQMDYNSWRFRLSGTPYMLSDVHNKFTVIGCNTLAYIDIDDNGKGGYQSGCVSTCGNLSVCRIVTNS